MVAPILVAVNVSADKRTATVPGTYVSADERNMSKEVSSAVASDVIVLRFDRDMLSRCALYTVSVCVLYCTTDC